MNAGLNSCELSSSYSLPLINKEDKFGEFSWKKLQALISTMPFRWNVADSSFNATATAVQSAELWSFSSTTSAVYIGLWNSCNKWRSTPVPDPAASTTRPAATTTAPYNTHVSGCQLRESTSTFLNCESLRRLLCCLDVCQWGYWCVWDHDRQHTYRYISKKLLLKRHWTYFFVMFTLLSHFRLSHFHSRVISREFSQIYLHIITITWRKRMMYVGSCHLAKNQSSSPRILVYPKPSSDSSNVVD